jgi:hypothetical protein
MLTGAAGPTSQVSNGTVVLKLLGGSTYAKSVWECGLQTRHDCLRTGSRILLMEGLQKHMMRGVYRV